MLNEPTASKRKSDMADHFMACSKLGRHLTVMDESRFVITDDFHRDRGMGSIANTVASIYSRDLLVAQAALLPLGKLAGSGNRRRRERFEELFTLIEESALSPDIRNSADTLLKTGFKEAQIRFLEAELGGTISPARKRYRQFLDMVRGLIDKKVSASTFRDEFLAFTAEVAGKLDFGIYSFCLDRIFGSPLIPLDAKRFLVGELIKYPRLIRRELLSNLLALRNVDPVLKSFVRDALSIKLDNQLATEIHLLEQFKLSRLSLETINEMLAGTMLPRKAEAADPVLSGVNRLVKAAQMAQTKNH